MLNSNQGSLDMKQRFYQLSYPSWVSSIRIILAKKSRKKFYLFFVKIFLAFCIEYVIKNYKYFTQLQECIEVNFSIKGKFIQKHVVR